MTGPDIPAPRCDYHLMRLIAIETSHRAGSLAAFSDDAVLLELALAAGQGTAQSIGPGLKTLLEEVGWKPADVQLVAVTVGPGSFTGLRVGLTAAKTFAYAAGSEVLGIDTLEAIAAGAPAELPELAVAVDAQRGEVVAATFQRDPDGQLRSTGQRLVELETWLASLAPGTPVASPVLEKRSVTLPPHVTALDREFWFPKAATVAHLAARDYAAGRRDDLWKLLPRYSRRSAAEEKWEATQRGDSAAR